MLGRQSGEGSVTASGKARRQRRGDRGAHRSEPPCLPIEPMRSCRIWRASGRLAATALPEHFVVKTKATSSSCPSMRPPNLILPNHFSTNFTRTQMIQIFICIVFLELFDIRKIIIHAGARMNFSYAAC